MLGPSPTEHMLLGKQQASSSVELCLPESPLICSWLLHLSDGEDGSLHNLDKLANGGGIKTWGPLALNPGPYP